MLFIHHIVTYVCDLTFNCLILAIRIWNPPPPSPPSIVQSPLRAFGKRKEFSC